MVALAILSNCATHFHDVHTYVAERLVAVCALVAKNFLRTLDQGPEAATEFGRTVGVLLATINTCLTTNPAANTNLIYSLMAHKKDFDPLRSCGHFASEVENIFIVVDHFERRLERHGTTTLSVNTVLDVIREGGNRMPTTQLKVRACVRVCVWRSSPMRCEVARFVTVSFYCPNPSLNQQLTSVCVHMRTPHDSAASPRSHFWAH